jgi:hypothetical protein
MNLFAIPAFMALASESENGHRLQRPWQESVKEALSQIEVFDVPGVWQCKCGVIAGAFRTCSMCRVCKSS